MAYSIRKLRAGEQADMWGDGNKIRDCVFIGDVVRANLRALEIPDDHPDPVFNIGTGIETKLIDPYEWLAEMLRHVARPRFHPNRVGEQMRYSLASGKERRQLGWEPRWNLDDRLRQTIAAALTGVPR